MSSGVSVPMFGCERLALDLPWLTKLNRLRRAAPATSPDVMNNGNPGQVAARAAPTDRDVDVISGFERCTPGVVQVNTFYLIINSSALSLSSRP